MGLFRVGRILACYMSLMKEVVVGCGLWIVGSVSKAHSQGVMCYLRELSSSGRGQISRVKASNTSIKNTENKKIQKERVNGIKQAWLGNVNQQQDTF